jgi:hypothetical protein
METPFKPIILLKWLKSNLLLREIKILQNFLENSFLIKLLKELNLKELSLKKISINLNIKIALLPLKFHLKILSGTLIFKIIIRFKLTLNISKEKSIFSSLAFIENI